jgi:hypothetical protein
MRGKTMYEWVRSGQWRGGKSPAAKEWAKKVTTFMNEKYPGHAWEVFTETFDNIQALHFTANYASLAEFESISAALAKDDGYQALIKNWTDYAIDGSWRDRLWVSI